MFVRPGASKFNVFCVCAFTSVCVCVCVCKRVCVRVGTCSSAELADEMKENTGFGTGRSMPSVSCPVFS